MDKITHDPDHRPRLLNGVKKFAIRYICDAIPSVRGRLARITGHVGEEELDVEIIIDEASWNAWKVDGHGKSAHVRLPVTELPDALVKMYGNHVKKDQSNAVPLAVPEDLVSELGSVVFSVTLNKELYAVKLIDWRHPDHDIVFGLYRRATIKPIPLLQPDRPATHGDSSFVGHIPVLSTDIDRTTDSFIEWDLSNGPCDDIKARLQNTDWDPPRMLIDTRDGLNLSDRCLQKKKVEFIASWTKITDEKRKAKFDDECEFIVHKVALHGNTVDTYDIEVRARVANRYYIPFIGIYRIGADITVIQERSFGSIFVI